MLRMWEKISVSTFESEGKGVIFYFEFRDASYEELKKFEIETTENGNFVLLEIEPPCNDRRLLAQSESIAELVDWALNNC